MATDYGTRLATARKKAKLTQVQLGKMTGIAQSTISTAEREGQGSADTPKFAKACDVDAYWLATGETVGPLHKTPYQVGNGSTAHSHTVIGSAGVLKSLGFNPDIDELTFLRPILAREHPDDLPAGEFVMIPRLDVHLSAGHGKEQVEIELVVRTPQAFRADWIRQERLRPSMLACMKGDGPSMEPSIFDGDSLVVDTSQNEVIDGKAYAMWYDGGERVKRLFRLPGGGLRIKSDNAAFEPITLNAMEVEHVRVIGRVVHRSGKGNL